MCWISGATHSFTMTHVGNTVYVIRNYSTSAYFYVIDVPAQTNAAVNYIGTADSGQSQMGGSHIIANESGTELHLALSTKNSTYLNSFNVRYTKYSIASSAWGAVEQVTIDNFSSSYPNFGIDPTITIVNGTPFIFIAQNDRVLAGAGTSNTNVVVVLKRDNSLTTGNSLVNTNWSYKQVYNSGGTTFTQSSPFALFVPQKLNGLTNGRIWLVWHGKNSGNSNDRSRYSYSDDLGLTWSPMVLVSDLSISNYGRPTITANRNNDIFVISDYIDTQNIGVRRMAKGETVFSSWATYSSTGNYPSALYDPTLNFTEPLFIYKGTSKVGFKGTWVVTNISVPPGHIGAKSDRSNLLSYAITTDGTMGTITEKVNDVIVGTKTAASGESLTVGLTQEQWDAVKFGGYANATGGKNTLTIEMGTEKWTYTFKKMPAADADLISAAKAHKDHAEVVDPARRAHMAATIRSKGRSVLDTDDWETLDHAVEGIELGKRTASGVLTSSTTVHTFTDQNGNGANSYYIDIPKSVLGFIPGTITAIRVDKASPYMSLWMKENHYVSGTNHVNTLRDTVFLRSGYDLFPDKIRVPVSVNGYSYTWKATEE